MATGEQISPLKGKKTSSSTTKTRNESDNQWLLLPNNLELGAKAKPSKKQRNKEKHRHFQKENLSSSDIVDSLSCKTGPFQNFPPVKTNTASWLKDQFMNDSKDKRQAYDSEQVFSDSDLPQPNQQNVNFPPNQPFTDLDHEHHMLVPQRSVNTDNIKSVKDELKKRETAIVCEILSSIQEFISEAESSWEMLDLSDEPVIKDAFVKLKNAVRDVEGDRENKLQHLASENGFTNGVSRSSSTSRVSSSKENIFNRDSSMNTVHCYEAEQAKCNRLHERKVPEADSASSDDCSISDVGERVAVVEWERKKLKNKLIELQEEKKIKDELLRELCYLKDAASTASSAEFLRSKEKKKKLCKYQSPSQHRKMPKEVSSEDNQNIILESSDTPTSQIALRQNSSTSVKRDNVRKEQNSAFPARRHYEAEGRANEDPDIPAASAPAPSPILDTPEMHDKIKKLKVAQQHVKVIKDIVVSILESRKTGSIIPLEQSHLLTPLHRPDHCFSYEESSDESGHDEFLQAGHLSSFETATNIKEICSDGLKSPILDVDSHKSEEAENVVPDNLESSVGKMGDLVKLQSQFQYLMQIFPPAEHKNDDPVRSSGEGAYTQKKNPNNIVPENAQKPLSVRTVPLQDNLQITRQNIVISESQNPNPNYNLHIRDCNSVKKDNINNLSGKIGKNSLQNSVNSSYPDVITGSNNNMDTMSTFSYDLNQNHSLPNEVERKTILDILKRDKKKQKQYDRNQDKTCCNSSVDSEPIEDSNSALAVDSTAIAAWGGSSTQDNFEDEENAGSFEQDDEENVSVFDKASLRGHGSASQYSGQFSSMHHFMESVANVPDKRQQRNFNHPLYNRSQNQSILQAEYPQLPAQALNPTRRPVSSPNTNAGIQRDFRDASCVADTSEHCSQHNQTPKFIQQLKNHLDQLNALCQNQLFNDQSQTSFNCQQTQSYRFPNTCGPFQPGPELAQPFNQQLLLSLSQCYHALYMQQLEIQQLQHSMWHNLDTENVQQPNNLSSRSHHEDPSIQSYSAPTWLNPFAPSNNFPPDISPIPPAPYYLPIKPYPPHNGPCGSVCGTQPARAVIHPTNQNNMTAQETLNNQVPPRTRANNFWDNFRSYSRQNLLSTSNPCKRNENISSFSTPQVRQIHPSVTSESQNRISDMANACCNTTSFSEYNRPIQDAVNFPKKVKSNVTLSSTTASDNFQKKGVPAHVAQSGLQIIRCNKSHRLNMEPTVIPPVSNSHSTNLIQLQSVQDKSRNKNSSLVSPNLIHREVHEVSGANALSGACNVISHEPHSDFLIGLFHEVQSLKSDALRQKALKIIKDLALSERQDNEDISQTKLQNDQPLISNKAESLPSNISNQTSIKQPIEMLVSTSEVNDIERTPMVSDNACGNIQNLPTTAIPPFSKHGTSRTEATGAVRKKSKILSTCFSDMTPNSSASRDSGGSTADSSDPPAVLTVNKAIEDVPGFITEKVLSDLTSRLPSLKRRLLRDGCYQTFWNFVSEILIEGCRTHLFSCNIRLFEGAVFDLRKTVYLFMTLFSGITLADFETDLLKFVEEFIHENITCFIANGHFATVPPSLQVENLQWGIEDKKQELHLKFLKENSDQMKELSIKMPIEESDNFPQYRTPSPDLFPNLCGYENLIETTLEPDCVGTRVEGFACGYNPEAEIEPEVEIGTEADLAEADQSPGQQGSVGDSLPPTESWSTDQEAVLSRNMPSTGAILLNSDDITEIGNSLEAATGSVMSPDACMNHEAILDDIPIKLCPSQEEDLPQQHKEEQPLPLSSDDNSHSEFISNNCGDGVLSNLR